MKIVFKKIEQNIKDEMLQKVFFLFVLISCICQGGIAQAIPDDTMEQKMESMIETNEELSTDDDSYIQQLRQFRRNPINLNYTNGTELFALMILSQLQIQDLLSYRNQLGNFISIYELQAIPGWDLHTIEKLRPYITVCTEIDVIKTIGQRIKNGTKTILATASQQIEKSKGYKLKTGTATNFYSGSPQHLFIRYKYNFKNVLQYGFTCEKDPGEQFFKGYQQHGFDFYSAHFFAKNIGIIRSLALGDYQLNIGQGLIHWLGPGYKKSADVIFIKRQSSVSTPYNSAGEIYFHRGAAISIGLKKFEITAFASFRKIDANLVTDTSHQIEDYISSLQTSGLHRTKNEIADKGIQRQLLTGASLAFNTNTCHFTFNRIQYNFSLPIIKSSDPYNQFAIAGNKWSNYSIDYSFTHKNIHFFGEAAIDKNMNTAFINGLLLSASATVDLSILYRNISKKYQALYANAFTENSAVNNEKGLFTGIRIRPNDFWRVDLYADIYKFPFLKYGVDAPSVGSDYLVEINYQPSKQIFLYSRYRNETKQRNENYPTSVLRAVVAKSKQDFRTQLTYKFNQSFSFRERIEMIWYDKKGQNISNGFLIFSDIIFVPSFKKYSTILRLQYFETDNYDSRLYCYEDKGFYSYSLPVFYGKGFRYFINTNYAFGKKFSVWIGWSQTIYQDRTSIGTGLDEILGNRRSDISLQMKYRF